MRWEKMCTNRITFSQCRVVVIEWLCTSSIIEMLAQYDAVYILRKLLMGGFFSAASVGILKIACKRIYTAFNGISFPCRYLL